MAANLSARSIPFTPACPGQYTHNRENKRWIVFNFRLPRVSASLALVLRYRLSKFTVSTEHGWLPPFLLPPSPPAPPPSPHLANVLTVLKAGMQSVKKLMEINRALLTPHYQAPQQHTPKSFAKTLTWYACRYSQQSTNHIVCGVCDLRNEHNGTDSGGSGLHGTAGKPAYGSSV